ncbi:MAG: 16S rRNA methyltransferase [Methylibium sp. NZG]|nr:MAG: 16S rRNA methyltransferase [Methylibium sp. NZG]
MSDAEPQMLAALQHAAKGLALELHPPQIDALLQYLALLQRWNGTYNLTSVRDPAQMLNLHLVDCLAVMNPLRRQLASQATGRVLDVGSGAGLPGVVIATLHPALDVWCIDTVGKKAAFIQQVAAELALKNLHAVHGRVEEWQAAAFDIVTSRAFASLPDFVAQTQHHLAPTGVWLAMKGKHPAIELTELPPAIDVFHVEPLIVPGLDAERCLIWMKPRR